MSFKKCVIFVEIIGEFIVFLLRLLQNVWFFVRLFMVMPLMSLFSAEKKCMLYIYCSIKIFSQDTFECDMA